MSKITDPDVQPAWLRLRNEAISGVVMADIWIRIFKKLRAATE